MNINGENLRIYANGRVVAAALNATLHLAVQTEDATTKDSPSGWDEIKVTGKSLELTSEALVQVSDVQEFPSFCDKRLEGAESTLFTDGKEFLITGGSQLTVNSNNAIIPVHIISPTGQVLATSRGLPVTYSTTASSTTVRIACPIKGHLASGAYKSNGYTTQEFINLLKSSSDVMVDMAIAEGWNNRTEANVIVFAEKAYVTDVNINAASKQRASYTVTLKCSGDVSFDDGASISTLSLGEEEQDDNEPTPAEE